MKMGRLKALAVFSSLSVVLALAPDPAAADGNANLHLFKFVDSQQLNITPNLGVTLTTDKASAIPGDRLTYTAVVTNPTAGFGMGGYFNAQSTASSDATIRYYWDELEYCGSGFDCGNGTSNLHWTPVATFENGQSGYLPIGPPRLHTGMTLAVQPVNRSGVTYPTSGDLVLGTVIKPKATATWTYLAKVTLTPAQLSVLADPTTATYIRNVLHLEMTVRNSTAAQPATDPELFTSPFTSMGNPGAVRGVTVTFTLPDGSKVVVGPSQVPGLSVLSPGGSASATATYTVPAPGLRGTGESELDYGTRLASLDSAALKASATTSGAGFSGTVFATSPTVTTIENVPIVTIAKTGPATLTAGTTETNPLTLTNIGGAAASSLAVDDSVPGGAHGTVSGVPATLATGASATASAAFAVPIDQADGSLTDTAAVTWKDTHGNSYGSFSGSFTTAVRNPLVGARLILAPITAGPNTVGTTQQLTATLEDRDGNPLVGRTITLTVTGANPGTLTATTGPEGKASFTYTGANGGNDVAQATFTSGGVTLTSNTSTISWGKPLQTVTTSVVDGNFFANANNSCTFDIGPTSTPVFNQQFPDILFNPPNTAVPHDISAVNTFTRPFTDLTVDVNGNYNGEIVAQGNGQQAGNASLTNFYAELTGSFTVNQAGDLTFAILHDDGYIIGVGGNATRLNGDLEGNPPANTPFNGYPVVAAFNGGSSGGSSSGTFTVHFPAAGTYPYELDYTECGAGALFLVLQSARFVAQTDPLSVYVGYADGLRPGGSVFPFPWQGSPNVIFEGGGCCDNGAIRFDNSGTDPITFDSVVVDIGPFHYDLWPKNVTLPPGQILILTGTSGENFDTSDTTGGCNQSGFIPAVRVTRAGVTTTFNDTTQVINTGGVDQATCTGGNESRSWTRIGGGGTAISIPLPPGASLDISPFKVANAVVGQDQQLTVSAMDGAGNPVANLPVTLQVFGTNTQILNATTLSTGLATFHYVGLSAGVDSITASAFVGGLRALSNTGSVTWSGPGGTNGPPPPTITSPAPADGTVVTKPVAVDATFAPPSGATITSWRVFYQAVAGGPQVVIGSGTGTPPSPLGVTFDPTLLADGVYKLTIEATSDNGGLQDVSRGVTVTGGLKLGRYATTFNDMSAPVNGFQMQVDRTYDSTDESSGDFGVGWHVGVSNFRISSNHLLGASGWTQYNKSCIFGLCLTAFANSAPRFVTVVYPDQHSEIFDFLPDGGTNIFWSCTPLFKARPGTGTSSTLVPLDDTSCSYTGDGNLYGSGGPYNPQRFLLTTRSGQVLVLDVRSGLVSETDRNANHLTIDAGGVHSSSGPAITFERDGSGRIVSMTGPAGQKRTYTYSAFGDLASSIDPLGNVTAYTYDSSHRLLQVSGPQGPLSTQTYDAAGRLIAIADAIGHTTRIANDPGTQTATFTDANGTTTTVLRSDDQGNVLSENISSGGQTVTITFAYDSVGHVTRKTDALGHSINAAYDAEGDVTRYTDANGRTSQFSYDEHGNLTSVTDPDGEVVQGVTYDVNGNPVSMLGPGGAVVHFANDSAGRPVSRTDATGAIISYTYDPAGHMVGLTDATGHTTAFSYDAGGRVTSSTDAVGATQTFTYDAADDLVALTDPLGDTQSFTYDSLGRMSSSTDALGRKTTVQHDADGRLTSVTDRDGRATAYTYDADGHLVRVDYPGGEFVAYVLDGFGRPKTVSNSSSRIDNAYDAAGHLVSSTTTAGGLSPVTLGYTYDAEGNRLTSTGPDGSVTYAYDSRSRVVGVTDTKGGAFRISYDSASRVTAVTRPNGVDDAYTYDSAGRLVGIASTLSGTSIQNLSQTLDADGQVTSRTDSSGTTSFSHDTLGRLVAVNGPVSSQTYSYDAAGNRTTGPMGSSTYNAADQLLSDPGFTYTYDAEGNRTSKTDRTSGATTHYVYNGAGQLTAIQYPDGTSASYTYDALGRRLSVTSGGVTTSYIYDGVNARLEYLGNSLAATYVGSGKVDHPLEMVRGASSYYYLQDLQGSVADVTNESGAVSNRYAYDAFGAPTSAQAPVANPFTYTGREYESKSGLYYNRARYYDPSAGAFLSADPVSQGQPYAYAGQDPVDFADPSGAFLADVAIQYTKIALQYVNHLKLFGCALAALGAIIEVTIDWASSQPTHFESWIAIGAGVATACAIAAIGAGPASALALIALPIVAGLVGAVVDYMLQLKCASDTGNFSTVSPTHAITVGLAALGIAAGAAVLGAVVEGAAATSQLDVALGSAILSGDGAALIDLTLKGGACG